MNILLFINKTTHKIQQIFHILFFLFIKKPLYILSYNSNGNHFVCKGLIINSSLKVSGKNNQIFIDKKVKMNNMQIVISGNNNRLIIHRGVIFHEGGRVKL